MFNKIKQKEIIDFNKTLSLLLLAKLSIIQSLEIICGQSKSSELKSILKIILTELKTGKSLSLSFAKYPKIFPKIYIANLKAAEETNQIAEVLYEYSNYEESVYTLKKKIIQASRYPLLVLGVSFLAISFMVFFLIPSFEGIFFASNSSLPLLTEFIINFSYLIKNNFVYLMILFTSIFFLFFKLKSNSILTNKTDRLLLTIPYLSKVYKSNILARFSFTMHILLKNKITLIESLDISKNISQNVIFKKEINKILNKVNKGESLSLNFKHSYFFDETFSKLIVAGEESAEMDKVFLLISDYYSKDFDYQMESLMSVIEPILIFIVGIFVALVVIAMYLPMFEIVNNFGI
ncbi:MAG TPA: type II secretion system F family protein [Ignavibacteriaceae bacterium]|nr:type II secretion system F family protein [Ignavibacteriaceae bacterium]